METNHTQTNQLIRACANNLKIKFRLRSTPAGCYILFHPYSIFIDRQQGKEKLYGRVENHYHTTMLNNELCCLALDKVAEVIVLEIEFHKPTGWKSRIDAKRYRTKAMQPARFS